VYVNCILSFNRFPKNKRSVLFIPWAVTICKWYMLSYIPSAFCEQYILKSLCFLHRLLKTTTQNRRLLLQCCQICFKIFIYDKTRHDGSIKIIAGKISIEAHTKGLVFLAQARFWFLAGLIVYTLVPMITNLFLVTVWSDSVHAKPELMNEKMINF